MKRLVLCTLFLVLPAMASAEGARLKHCDFAVSLYENTMDLRLGGVPAQQVSKAIQDNPKVSPGVKELDQMVVDRVYSMPAKFLSGAPRADYLTHYHNVCMNIRPDGTMP